MVVSGQLLGFAGRVLTVLLVLSSCADADLAAPARAVPTKPVVERSVVLPSPDLPSPDLSSPVPQSPLLPDTDGAPLRDEHADVVQAVYRALAAGDLDALGELYTGDDWAGQAALLASDAVRRSVLDALSTSPANLGEGYLYPGFSADPTTDYRGYQTAFFLDYDPPHSAEGPLRWRGIATLPHAPVPLASVDA